MYGQMTAGSWIYIGTQGILQGTYETFAALARRHFGGIAARAGSVVTAGLGGMGGAQPLAVTMNGGVALVVEVDPRAHRAAARDAVPRRRRRDRSTRRSTRAARTRSDAASRARSASRATPPTCCRSSSRRGVMPDVLTDQTSAHDALNGYVPNGMTLAEAAAALRERDPEEYVARSMRVDGRPRARDARRCRRAARSRSTTATTSARRPQQAGVADAFDIPGFVPEYIRPLFCEGKGPFRWAALSGDPGGHRARPIELVLEMFPDDEALRRWIRLAGERVAFQGLPARICWLGYGERAKFGLAFNELVRTRRA